MRRKDHFYAQPPGLPGTPLLRAEPPSLGRADDTTRSPTSAATNPQQSSYHTQSSAIRSNPQQSSYHTPQDASASFLSALPPFERAVVELNTRSYGARTHPTAARGVHHFLHRFSIEHAGLVRMASLSEESLLARHRLNASESALRTVPAAHIEQRCAAAIAAAMPALHADAPIAAPTLADEPVAVHSLLAAEPVAMCVKDALMELSKPSLGVSQPLGVSQSLGPSQPLVPSPPPPHRLPSPSHRRLQQSDAATTSRAERKERGWTEEKEGERKERATSSQLSVLLHTTQRLRRTSHFNVHVGWWAAHHNVSGAAAKWGGCCARSKSNMAEVYKWEWCARGPCLPPRARSVIGKVPWEDNGTFPTRHPFPRTSKRA